MKAEELSVKYWTGWIVTEKELGRGGVRYVAKQWGAVFPMRSLATTLVPYRGKFLLVQNFAQLFVNPIEEKFRGFSFCVFSIDRLHRVCYDVTSFPLIQNFTALIFTAADRSAKNANFCTVWKFSAIRYVDIAITLCCVVVALTDGSSPFLICFT